MIYLKSVELKDKEMFWNINQKYLYEMTMYYKQDMDENGNLHYGYFDEYFIDPKRSAYFIMLDNKIIGFVMIHPYSMMNLNIDYSIAEFTIFPSYRKNGYAKEAVNLLFAQFKGKWEIKFNNKNIGAMKLWNSVTNKFSPNIIRLNENEIILEFEN